MRKRRIAVLVVLSMLMLFAGAVCAYGDDKKKDFSCDVAFLKQEEDRYVFQVTAENKGEDYAGTLRLVFTSQNSEACAYDTEISLPKDGKKQFTVTIPEQAIETTRGNCTAAFLDGDGETLQSFNLKNVLGGNKSGITVGILSDRPDDLTWLDMGGVNLNLQNVSAPLALLELDADNLEGYLDGLYFLVIDRFDVASLGGEKLAAIEDWVKSGGWLIIGTGEYGEQTLGGFDPSFLEMSVAAVSEPGEENYASDNARRSGYYYSYTDAGVDFSQMAVANLVYLDQNVYFWESSECPGACARVDDGAVFVTSVSLGDAELKKGSGGFFENTFYEVMYASNSYNQYSGYSSMDYFGQRALAVIDQENTDVDFTWLKIIIAIYVVLVGPLLYLILRKCKKSEWYWIGAPLLGLLFILGVFVFGRDIRVTNTKVYSVSVQEAGSTRIDTYYDAYHSGTKRWSLKLNDNYEVAGPGFTGNNYYSFANGDYHYVLRNDSEGLSIGMKPTENFESGFLYASGRAEAGSGFSGDGLKGKLYSAMSGRVTNQADSDFALLAVRCDNYVMIFSDVKAGETLDIAQAVKDGRCLYESEIQSIDDMYYNQFGYYYGSGIAYSSSANTYSVVAQKEIGRADMAALFVGLGIADEKREQSAYGAKRACIVGLVTDSGRTVAGRCEETAYSCLYSFADIDMEEVYDAAN
ncbi:MAG: hypothetical protein NC355_01380 [Blautia sp.]|nr:hypothetical protein [Blautia sp.]